MSQREQTRESHLVSSSVCSLHKPRTDAATPAEIIAVTLLSLSSSSQQQLSDVQHVPE